MKKPTRRSTAERTLCKARKLDRTAAVDQHARGLSTGEIARLQGVNPSTVFRFLRQTKPERQALEQFKQQRGNVLARLQAKSLDVQEAIMDSLKENGVLVALTPHQKTGLLSVLSAQMGTAYDKERLERGRSTANVSLVNRMMAEAMDRAGSPTTDGSEGKIETAQEEPKG